MSKIYQKITDLIGGTPLLELANYEKKNNGLSYNKWCANCGYKFNLY